METKGYTQDGTVDLRGRPVLASKTGRWKACAFLVGARGTFKVMCITRKSPVPKANVGLLWEKT
ncbi:hypothetical protein QQP08_004205 [Theobroma cacao]|nr:hypothetical protein QQP08_004205 [Theobroma cacao]